MKIRVQPLADFPCREQAGCRALRAHTVIEQGGEDGAIAHALEFIPWGSSRNSWGLVIAGEKQGLLRRRRSSGTD
jgi:hypothetical protein